MHKNANEIIHYLRCFPQPLHRTYQRHSIDQAIVQIDCFTPKRMYVHAIKRIRLTADRNCLTNGRLHLNRSGTFDVDALMLVDHH